MVRSPGSSNLWSLCLTQGRRQRLGSGCIVQQRSRFFKITQQTQPTILSHRTNVLLSVSVVRCKSCIDFLYPLLCIFKKKLFTTVSRVRLNSVNFTSTTTIIRRIYANYTCTKQHITQVACWTKLGLTNNLLKKTGRQMVLKMNITSRKYFLEITLDSSWSSAISLTQWSQPHWPYNDKGGLVTRQTVASICVTLSDENFVENRASSFTFDSDGTIRTPRTAIGW